MLEQRKEWLNQQRKQDRREQINITHKKRVAKLKHNKMCICCAKPSIENRTMCAECQKRSTLASTKSRNKRKKLMLCVDCGAKAYDGKLQCPDCKLKRVLYQVRRKHGN